jgi:WD40 repeat protein
MKRRLQWKFALLLIAPVAVYFYIAERNSWRPKAIELPDARVGWLKFSPDGRYLLVTDVTGEVAHNIVVYDLTEGQVTNTIKEAGNPHFLEEGKSLAVFSGSMYSDASRTRVLSFPELRPLREHPSFGLYKGFKDAWPDDKTLSSQDEKDNIILWDIKTGTSKKIKLPLPSVARSIYDLRFLPDNRTVFIAEIEILIVDGDGKKNWDMRFCDIQTKRCRLVKQKKNLDFLNASPNGICAFRDNNGNVEIWDYKTGQSKRTIKGNFSEVELSTDGATLATISSHADGGLNITLWDTHSGQRLRVLKGRSKGMGSLAFSPDGHTLAVGNYYGFVQLWRVK